MLWAKLSTAITRNVGPILDSTGAEYTGAVIGDLTIRKSDGSGAAMASAATLTHVDNGHYTLVTTTGNMDTVGRLEIRCNKATYQMPSVEMMVLPAAVYDTLITNGTLASNTSGRTQVVDAAGIGDANMVKAGPTGAGTAQTARDLGLALPAVAPNAAGGLLITAAGSLDMDEMNVDIEAIETRVTLALPNAAPQAAGGLITSTAGSLDIDEMNVDVEAIETRVTLALPSAAPQAAGGLVTSAAGSLDLDDLAADVDATETRVTTALPNAAPQSAGGLITSTAGSLDLDEMNVDIEAIQVSTAGLTYTVPNQVDANALKIGGTTQTGADVGSIVTENGADLDEIIVTLGAAGAGLTALGDTRLANLDVASSTLATATNMAEANADLDELIVTVGAAGAGLTAVPDSTTVTEIGADVDELITTIGVAGAGLTGVPGTGPTAVQIRQEIDSNSTALAEINADADEMIVTLANILADTDASLAYASGSVVTGTVGSATTPSTTQFTPSALGISCVDADQLRGSVIVFLTTTTTGGLKAQKSIILHSSAAALPLITLGNPDTDTTTPLTRAPSAGDVFFIL